MKKGWKIFWSICAVSVIIGVICVAIAFGMGFQFDYLDRIEDVGEYAGEEQWEIFEGIHTIDADLHAGEFCIYRTDKTEIEVKTTGINHKIQYQVEQDGGVLKISTKSTLAGLLGQHSGKVHVYIPIDYILQEADIDMKSGVIYMEDIEAEELSVDIGAGEARILDFHADEADFDCGAGEMTIYGCANDNVDLDCGIGNINYNAFGNEEDYNYRLSCGIGEIVCGNHSYSGIGSDRTVNNSGGRNMKIECGMGNVNVEFDNYNEGKHHHH